jgi:HK97 family phage portal protein
VSSNSSNPGLIARARSWLASRIEPRAIKYNAVDSSSDAAAEYFGLPTTTAGVWVDERVAMQIGTFFACIRNIADDTAKCSVVIGERLPSGERRIVRDDPLHHVLNVEFNPEMCAMVGRSTIMAHAVSWGNGYGEIQWRVDGGVGAIWPLTPDKMVVRRGPSGLQYVYDGKPIDAANVIHIPGPGWDGRVGYSPARLARESLGSVIATERFGAAFFGNGARLSGSLTHPGKLSPGAFKNLKESFDERHTGAHNAGRPIILEEGMKWEQMSVPPEDAQFLLTRQFQVPEICRWFRMPPHKVADLAKATFSNIEHQSIEYVTDCLLGWMIRAEQEFQRKCYRGRSNMFVKHNVNTLLRGDAKARFESYGIGRQWGWLTVNDILRLEDMDPIGPEGDVHMVPSNMQPAESLTKPAEPTPPPANPPPAPPDDDDGEYAAAERIIDVFAEQAIATCKMFEKVESDKASRSVDIGALRAEFMPRHLTYVGDRMRGLANLIQEAVRAGCPSVPELFAKAAAARGVAEIVDRRTAKLSTDTGWTEETSAADGRAFIDTIKRELRTMKNGSQV